MLTLWQAFAMVQTTLILHAEVRASGEGIQMQPSPLVFSLEGVDGCDMLADALNSSTS